MSRPSSLLRFADKTRHCSNGIKIITESKANVSTTPYAALTVKRRYLIISASLLTLFLGALDALVMAAAMPTVVADLGGIDLYSWVYSAYLLTRTVALPIFGKLADLYRTKTLYIVSILIFIAASLAAGFAKSMLFLIVCRAIQGIGAGGNFATVGVGLCGGIFTFGFSRVLHSAWAQGVPNDLPPNLAVQIHRNAEILLRPDIQALLSPEMLLQIRQAVAHGVMLVFWTTVIAASFCLLCCWLLPRESV